MIWPSITKEELNQKIAGLLAKPQPLAGLLDLLAKCLKVLFCRHVCETESEATEGQAVFSNSTNLLCCDWSYSEENERWYTGCGENWQLMNDEMKFCFNCGKKIKDTTK